MSRLKLLSSAFGWRTDAVTAGLVLDGPTPDLRAEVDGDSDVLVPLTEGGAWWIRSQFDPAPVEPAPGQVWHDHGVERVVDAVEEWDQVRWVVFAGGQFRPWIDFVGDPEVCCVMHGGAETAPAPPPGWRDRIACGIEGAGERLAARVQRGILTGGAVCIETIRTAARLAGALLRGRTA
jgi:hypothetical protein